MDDVQDSLLCFGVPDGDTGHVGVIAAPGVLPQCNAAVFQLLLNGVRSLNRPKSVLVVGIVCGFLIRSIWAWFVWPISKTLPFLFICFPLSTFVGCIIYYFIYKGAMKKETKNSRNWHRNSLESLKHIELCMNRVRL